MKALDAPNTKTIIVSYQKDFKRDNCEEGYGETVTYRKDIVYKVSEFALPEEKKKEEKRALEQAKQLVEKEGQDFVNNVGQCLKTDIDPTSLSFVAIRNVYESIPTVCSEIVTEKEIKAYSSISQQDAEEKVDKLVKQFQEEQTNHRSGGCLRLAPELLLAKCQFTYGSSTYFVMYNYFKIFPAYVKRDAYNDVIERVFMGDDSKDPYYNPNSDYYDEVGKSSMIQWCRDKVAEAGGEIITSPGGLKVFLSGFRVNYFDAPLNHGISELSEQDRQDLDYFKNDLWWYWGIKYWEGQIQHHYLDFYSSPGRVWTGQGYGYVQGDIAPPACPVCTSGN
ncbi:DUF5977 domain-containing protein [Ornithobacterium rhinotracheale]|nr:hypothetical protein [Ornithobacterium rhinotracheale]MBN3661648.1 hypothetical protein [Ornithobacterium rhinotracheale]MCK0193712.1 hypothetical protein [Ornithobacterium rhinotracheale]MCK0199341.1 hypothetical protein [Ornithobacterium rhinotracheale]MCK0203134.1 hypothetical protein [Ornithobacterium rhinotracheale]UOH63763.1 hypothetical protein MT993_00685 [Ornithobacterium rhinotracheale]